MTTAIERIRTVVEHADTVSPSDELRRRAARLLAVHPQRAADALQLAAALLWCEEQPHAEGLVSLDVSLREAALKEGLRSCRRRRARVTRPQASARVTTATHSARLVLRVSDAAV